MFTVSYFRSLYSAGPYYPDVYLYCYENGKVRLHRRGRYHRCDRWYSSFEDVVPVIESIVNSGKYDNFKYSDGDRITALTEEPVPC